MSNDKFNIRDALEFNSNEYVKYKNRLKKEIKRHVDNNDTSNKSYGEILELVLESVISFNQGKNVFDFTYMSAFGDKYDEQVVVINNILQKAYTLETYKDLSKLENKLGFIERGKNVNFFRKGKTDEWKTVLSSELISKIEQEFSEELKEFQYN